MDEDAAAGFSGRDQQPSMPFETEEEPFLDVERSDFQLLKRVGITIALCLWHKHVGRNQARQSCCTLFPGTTE